jgi:hypothetical protein
MINVKTYVDFSQQRFVNYQQFPSLPCCTKGSKKCLTKLPFGAYYPKNRRLIGVWMFKRMIVKTGVDLELSVKSLTVKDG